LFGQIYEYFLAEFARSEGSKGGEFFTPRSVVRLMVEMIEPHGGKVFDPACGSGGMFVQSAHFIEQLRKDRKQADTGVFVYGQEKTLETVNLAKMNLAVNGLRGEIKKANTYYEDPFGSFGAFDYVLANPPFNVDDVSLSSVEKDKRFNTYGIPRNKSKAKKKDKGKETVPNGNYLWINLFATSLKPKGRAALVMANSASDARHSEGDIRRTLIEKNLIACLRCLRICFIPLRYRPRCGSSTRPRPTTASFSLMRGISLLKLIAPTANFPMSRFRTSPLLASFTKAVAKSSCNSLTAILLRVWNGSSRTRPASNPSPRS
jgi:type I restriction enzyme M protein